MRQVQLKSLWYRSNELEYSNSLIRTQIAESKIVKSQVNKLESAVHNLQNNTSAPPKEFPVERTLVAQNVWYREDEDLEKVASTIIHHALNFTNEEITIKNVMQKSGWKSGFGLLKIELSDSDQLKAVLERKKDLNKADAWEIREIFLWQSKSESTLVMERNMDLVLRDMGVREDYVRVASGHLVKKSEFGGRGRGQGRGGRGRGRGRGAYSRGTSYRRQSSSSNRAGPAMGTINEEDPRVAQRDFRAENKAAREAERNQGGDRTIEDYMA